MSNPHITQIHALRQNARQFWAAWQQQEAGLSQLDAIDFVEQANELLQQFCEGCVVELEGVAPDDNALPSLVFSANGIVADFPQVQALAELAQTSRYQIRAFRSPLAQVSPDFAIGMDGFQLSVGDIVVALDEWRMLPALEIAFTCPIPADMAEHAQNMAMIMLDHVAGEWAAAVKIGAIDFVDEIAPERAITLPMLPEKLNAMWRELGYTGVYPQPEWQFATYEVKEDEERDAMVLIRNQSAASLIGRADMGWVVCVAAQLSGKDDLDAVYDLQDKIEAEAHVNQQGIATLSVMNMTEGVREMFFSTSDPAGLLEKAAALCSQCALPTDISCEYDPNWAYYRF